MARNGSMQVANLRGEKAIYDPSTGEMFVSDWEEWDSLGERMYQLQPIDTIPPCVITDADMRLCNVAQCAIFGGTPPTPADDAEKMAFRNAWESGRELRAYAVPSAKAVFSLELGVWADSFVVCVKTGHTFIVQFARGATVAPAKLLFPAMSNGAGDPWALRASMIQVVMLAGGYVGSKNDKPFGTPVLYRVPDDGKAPAKVIPLANADSDAALSIALRSRTEWWKDEAKKEPF